MNNFLNYSLSCQHTYWFGGPGKQVFWDAVTEGRGILLKKLKRKKAKASANVIDISGHKLVPKMRILSDKERGKMLKEYGIVDVHLPKISIYDPSIQALDPKINDVIEIERNDLPGKYLFYRLVIES